MKGEGEEEEEEEIEGGKLKEGNEIVEKNVR